jgi:hypothetical protein
VLEHHGREAGFFLGIEELDAVLLERAQLG